MATGTELCGKTLVEAAALVRRRELSPVELTRAVLDRIGALDGSLHSFITVTADAAMAEAKAAEAEIRGGHYRGPLHGVPIAVKDLCYTRGVRTTCASKILADFVPDHDATVVEKLRAAGAVILGKLGMTEFAYGGYHPTLPTPVNPRARDRWPGASSSGSGSATAAGALLRLPRLGHRGLHPLSVGGLRRRGGEAELGRVSRFGVFPLAASLDHIGPMTEAWPTPRPCSARSRGSMRASRRRGASRCPTTSARSPPAAVSPHRGGRVLLRRGHEPAVSGGVLDSVRVLREQGAEIREVRVRGLEPAARDWYVVCAVEAAVAHERTFPSRAADYGATFRALLEDGVRVSGVEYAQVQETDRRSAGRSSISGRRWTCSSVRRCPPCRRRSRRPRRTRSSGGSKSARCSASPRRSTGAAARPSPSRAA